MRKVFAMIGMGFVAMLALSAVINSTNDGYFCYSPGSSSGYHVEEVQHHAYESDGWRCEPWDNSKHGYGI